MTDPNVRGAYLYEYGDLHLTTDSGSVFDIQGESADRMAENIGISEEGSGAFDMPEQNWDNYARGSFR
jgi:hypothetical protein